MREARRVAIVMSRMPRLISPDASWLGGLRACLRTIQERGDLLLWSPGTAGAEFVSRGAQRLQLASHAISCESNIDDAAVKDQPLLEQADDVFALGVRRDGNVHRLLSARLLAGRSVCLVDLPGLQIDAVRRPLLAAGAETWTPSTSLQRPFVETHAARRDDMLLPEVVRIATPEVAVRETFLTHTTRACPGAWPRQSTDDYLDRLLDSESDSEHSALRTLARILSQRLLIGSHRTIRGGYPVVSFTAVPLTTLPELRCFRTHRAHWDFEPYGICIRRDALERHQVRPVKYGSDEMWHSLSDADRPFFQLSGSDVAGRAGNPPRNWSSEQEWRHLGDLDLSGFTAEEIFVFVPTYADAKVLQPHCPWLITLWPGELRG